MPIEHCLNFAKPNFIELNYYRTINLLKNYAWSDKPKPDNYTVGIWKIKYKK